MRRTPFTLFVVCAAMSLSAFGSAQLASQEGNHPANLAAGAAKIKPRERLKIANDLLAKMSLTPSQRTQISDVEAKLKAQVDKVHAQSKADPNKANKPQYRQKILALDKTFHQDLIDILTPAQRKEFRTSMRAALEKLAKEKASQPGGG